MFKSNERNSYPKEWVTAEEMRNVAEDISNSVHSNIINKMMDSIKESAQHGRLSTYICVSSSTEQVVLERVKTVLTNLGYKVNIHNSSIACSW